jgi:hypothetical protein
MTVAAPKLPWFARWGDGREQATLTRAPHPMLQNKKALFLLGWQSFPKVAALPTLDQTAFSPPRR